MTKHGHTTEITIDSHDAETGEVFSGIDVEVTREGEIVAIAIDGCEVSINGPAAEVVKRIIGKRNLEKRLERTRMERGA